MALMVAAAVGLALLTAWSVHSASAILALCMAAAAYILWNLYGTAGIVRLVLWETGVPPAIGSRVPRCGATPYFAVQLSLAAVVYGLAPRSLWPDLVWVALLPPVAYAVFLLEWRGMVVVSVLTMGILISGTMSWHGPGRAAYAAVAFSFALLFTLVFTLLAVHAEKSRNEVFRLADQLGQANRQLREYAVQAEDLAVNRERNRMAREVHDSLGHYLTVVNVQLEAARALQAVDPVRASEALATAQAFTQEGLQDIRGSLAALRVSPLDNQSLVDALRALAAAARSEAIRVEFELRGVPRRLGSPTELALYRTAQEGLTNVRKHARANHAKLILDYEDPTRVRVRVDDDGLGAVPGSTQGGFGLIGLRERAQLLRGTVHAERRPAGGFSLTMEVPG